MKSFIVRAAAVVGVIATSVLDTLKEEEEKKRLLDSGILEVDGMTGKEFENFLEVHFIKGGIKNCGSSEKKQKSSWD
jgi:restriction system protein/Holliday junction resolvase/Mrr family protein